MHRQHRKRSDRESSLSALQTDLMFKIAHPNPAKHSTEKKNLRAKGAILNRTSPMVAETISPANSDPTRESNLKISFPKATCDKIASDIRI